ncbi:MAG TPA: hypothetical protein VEL47_06055 [Myxococcota bacterium]|nr:hypothetical protein [Myxococcota bacterium]
MRLGSKVFHRAEKIADLYNLMKLLQNFWPNTEFSTACGKVFHRSVTCGKPVENSWVCAARVDRFIELLIYFDCSPSCEIQEMKRLVINCLFWLALFTFSSLALADSFQWELHRKRSDILQLIGKSKLHAIEAFSGQREIYRITQLLVVKGIGKKTVADLAELIGYRFEYRAEPWMCYKKKYC